MDVEHVVPDEMTLIGCADFTVMVMSVMSILRLIVVQILSLLGVHVVNKLPIPVGVTAAGFDVD